MTTAIDAYTAAFLSRRRATGLPVLNEGGLHGTLASAGQCEARLLVTADDAYSRLAELLPEIEAGLITALVGARRCTELLGDATSWQSYGSTAMIHRDLRAVPEHELPPELTLRPVQRLSGGSRADVRLADAVALATEATGEPADELFAHLQSLPSAFRLFAAVDRGGVVRATAGCGVFDTDATVIFVDTHPHWRGRGIGRAMSAAALHAAHDVGALTACLDASDAGVSIYEHLGFDTVAPTMRYLRRR